MRVQDILAALDAKYSFARAAKWDKVGLLIGDANASVEKVLVAHEVTDEVLLSATGFDALVVYHPPIFRPYRREISARRSDQSNIATQTVKL